MWKIISASVVAVAVAGLLASGSISANDIEGPDLQIPNPCDFITGGGFILTGLDKANFGAHGGCKNGSFWGHVNYVDHGGFLGTVPYHVQSVEITGYVMDLPNSRIICGVAKTNADEPLVNFRVRMQDNDVLLPDMLPDIPDMFEIQLSNGYVQSQFLAGGNIKLHKANPSTKPPHPLPDVDTICPPLGGGNGGGGPD